MTKAKLTIPHHIADLAPYIPGMPIEELSRQIGIPTESISKLASNENPLGASPRAQAAINTSMRSLHRYPDGYALRVALAAVHDGLSIQNVLIGNGSNDVLDIVARTFLEPGKNTILSQYAFGVYHIVSQSVGADITTIPALNYGHDLRAMGDAIQDNTQVIWLANPNNPTGTFIPYSKIKAFLSSVPDHIIVVLDEAYYEYLSDSDAYPSHTWIDSHPNLVIVRTFSKIYGLAGLRVGYAIANPEVIELMNRVRQPFNVNSVGIAAAVAALEDADFVRASQIANRSGVAVLAAGLEKLGLAVLPHYGNFVTFRTDDARGLHQKLLQAGIIVRPLSEYGLDEYLRVSVGTPDENDRFLAVLTKICTAG